MAPGRDNPRLTTRGFREHFTQISELEALVGIIQSSLQSIKEAVTTRNSSFPLLYTPVTQESEAIREIPEINHACSSIVSAAHQLVAVVRSPTLTAVAVGMQVGVSDVHHRAILLNRVTSIRSLPPWHSLSLQMSQRLCVKLAPR